MLYVRPANVIDTEKEWQFVKDMPADENGLTNEWPGIGRASFEDTALPEMIREAVGLNLPGWMVPETYLFLWDDETIVGQFRIRHFLNEALREGAGHIGYYIAPDFRGKGYGTLGLKLTLEAARKIVPEKDFYLRVNKDNPASLQVMKNNGGRIVSENADKYFVRITNPGADIAYGFYGAEHAFVPPKTESIWQSAVRKIRDEKDQDQDLGVSLIGNPRDLYEILQNLWCASTCAPRMRHQWTEQNKTLGQCSITAFLAQDIFGGKVYGIPLPEGGFHCYNVVGNCVFDLTSEQFQDQVLDYEENPEQFRDVHFAKEEKRLRYEYLKGALTDYMDHASGLTAPAGGINRSRDGYETAYTQQISAGNIRKKDL